MANKKISELSELLSPNADDVLAIVNDGATKKIQHSNYAANIRNLNQSLKSSELIVTGSLEVTGSYYVTGSVSMNALIDLAHVSQSLDFPGDAAAAAGGVPLGGVYRSGNVLAIRIQ